ncbi:ATP-dependent DNA helicase RecG [Sphingobacterium faecium]|jgi:ATP-dependent DNA helicase RecG|uniref:ATP-dependent DNA helicase RecG n=1 Tax=Sphingobacterium faecium TaxID=34087 RepID=UPI0004E600EC|nr:ATP-dependent DNA helicase RecG [Sphingobacterium faecium]WGQ13085.1 ATP-dependent DNA helicase RecG [Sphingobacterium faecium]CDS92545.1 ATP-dependent DNA helicase RecG [Sphingobacterium sp. PM2-P1-29]SJN51190.1 ATP-dependent DNA helicase RecG [Sphingobacterium faecium PCAi_F2.5]HCU45880.1 ATP-dependent DNA helicase RecG [Sphingobacterium sp.]
MADLSLITPIEYLKGVGPQKADVIKKELQIFTIGDLLSYYPFRYIDRTVFHKIRQLDADMYSAQVLGRLIGLKEVGEKKGKRLVGQFKDETGSIELVWFQSITWLQKSLKVGAVYVMYGKPSVFNGQISITHPEMEPYQAQAKNLGNMTLQPVYSSTEKLKKFNLDSKGIQKLQQTALETVFRQLPEQMPAYLLEKHQLMDQARATVAIHFPQSQEELTQAIKRIKFDELFYIQLKLLKNKQLNTKKFRGQIFSKVGDKFNTFFKERIPFPLTNAQKRVVKEIRQDTVTGAQMNRLVQGDVGSGKTVVALLTMLLAIDNGFQACMMAPTEILATQHFTGLKELLGEDICNIKLLTGSTTTKQRRVIHEELENGTLDILIGTHALIEDKVQFKNLGFVVIDEQHRFGVEQRAKLWRKNSIPPHMLVMTATPIPRTLAMTMYGDLDISVIDELPAGRKPIKTVHFFESSRLRMFGLMREEIAKGRQVYVVFPLIKESEKLDLLYLEAGLENIQREFPLPDYKISIVHGKMPVKDKDFEMQRFVKHETQIMVATTVIEVGVNVPNASVMVIENSERFGLSQLHQLRGRVGRGAEQSFCILMSGNKLSKEGKLRLNTMVRTNDGFEIAEVDLELRGPGDISGTQQSGVLELKLANLATDQQLLSEARNSVIDIFKEDPEMIEERHALLRQYLAKKSDGITWDKIS